LRPATLLRIAFAVIVTLWMIRRADPPAVGAALQSASWLWLGGAVLIVLIDRALMAYRWMTLLVPLDPGHRPPFGTVLRIFFVSTFVGSFLPNIGGDAVRTWSLAREGVRGSQSLASVLLDRLLGVVSIVIAAAAGLMLAPALAGDAVVQWSVAIGVAASAVGLAFVFSAALHDRLQRVVPRLPERLRQPSSRLLTAVRAYDAHRGALMTVLAASLAVQALRIAQAWMLGRGLGIDASVLSYFAYVPVILLVMQIPITVSGLGTSQFAFAVMFARAGVAEAPAVALSLLFVALGVVGNLPGALLYLTGGRERRPA
jgi:glycosyltransferase 2 family protein